MTELSPAIENVKLNWASRNRFLKNSILKTEHKKICKICGKTFITRRINTNICSFNCKQERVRQRARLWKSGQDVEKSPQKVKLPLPTDLKQCAICGFDKIIDLYYYGNRNAKVVPLCPNHHAMVHRKLLTLEII